MCVRAGVSGCCHVQLATAQHELRCSPRVRWLVRGLWHGAHACACEWLQGSGGVTAGKTGGSGGGAIVVLANATSTTYAEINGTIRVNGAAGTGSPSGDTATCGGDALCVDEQWRVCV